MSQSERPIDLVSRKSPEECFVLGTNLRKAKNSNEAGLSTILMTAIADLISFIDANKTISANNELTFTVESIIDGFPSMSVEEILLVFSKMKKGEYQKDGKYFERLKTPEILNALKLYESEERATMLEKHYAKYKDAEQKRYSEEIIPSDNANKYLEEWKEKISQVKKKNTVDSSERNLKSSVKIEYPENDKETFRKISTKINKGDELNDGEKKFMKKYDINV